MFMLKYMSIIITMMSTLITISFPSHPMIAWLGLELNSLGFIPLLKNNNNPSSNESMMKYFLIQSISSSFFLASWLFSYNIMNMMTINNINFILLLIMTLTLLMKLGMIPFHFWMFPLINSIKWFPFMFLMTWQKIAPLFLISYSTSKFIIMFILITSTLTPMMMMNQNSMKMFLGYASMIHLMWMMISMNFNTILFFQYLLMYMIMFMSTSYFFFYFNINFISQISLINNKYKFIFFFNMLSLSGFPPFIMFLSKMMLMIQLIQNNSFSYILIFLLFLSLLATYSYIHLNFPLILSPINLYLMKMSPMNPSILLMIILLPISFILILPFMLLLF